MPGEEAVSGSWGSTGMAGRASGSIYRRPWVGDIAGENVETREERIMI